MEYHCELCDISVKIKSKKRHLNSHPHKNLDKLIINRYRVESPDFIKIENILKNYVRDYKRKLIFLQLYVNGRYTFLIKSFMLKRTHGIIVYVVLI